MIAVIFVCKLTKQALAKRGGPYKPPSVSEKETSSRQNPVIQPATVSYPETMEHFDPEHYEQLVDELDNQEYPLEILEAATNVGNLQKKSYPSQGHALQHAQISRYLLAQ